MQVIHGIYRIHNKITDKSYIGQSYGKGGIYSRWHDHIVELRGNKHKNRKLQNAWNKYGESSFTFTILMVIPGVDQDELDKRECEFIAYFNSICNGYNLREGGRSGRVLDHQKDIARQNAIKQFSTPEGRKKASEAQLKRFREQGVSKETRELQSRKSKGRHATEATRARMSQSAKIAQRIRFDTQGVSEETRRKHSLAQTGKKRGPYKTKGIKQGPRNLTPAGRQRLRDSAKNRVISPETRKKMSESQKNRNNKNH